MKQIVVLIGVGVVLIFVITFASQYLLRGTQNQTSGPIAGSDLLRFPIKAVDWSKEEGPDATGEFEWTGNGSYDFWFVNDKEVAVEIRAEPTSCHRCTEVEFRLAPDDVKKLEKTERQKRAKDADLQWQPLRVGGDSYTVPAGGNGWVRIKWNGKIAVEDGQKVGAHRFRAHVWMEAGRDRGELDLEVPVNLIDPVQVEFLEPSKEYKMSVGDSEPLKFQFFYWSSTRPEFTLKKPETNTNPCVNYGEPRRLTEKEREEKEKLLGRPVRCAYYATVAVKEQAGEVQLDLGQFNIPVAWATDVPEQPRTREFTITGQIDGHVSVWSPWPPDGGWRDMIVLRNFPAKKGITYKARVHAKATISRLEVDTKQTSDVLRVQVEDKTGPVSEGDSWDLMIHIPGNALYGPLKPDTIVVLSIEQEREGKKYVRRIRIPVTGNAQH